MVGLKNCNSKFAVGAPKLKFRLVRKMETPYDSPKVARVGDIFVLTADELRRELGNRHVDIEGMSKLQLQQKLAELIVPEGQRVESGARPREPYHVPLLRIESKERLEDEGSLSGKEGQRFEFGAKAKETYHGHLLRMDSQEKLEEERSARGKEASEREFQLQMLQMKLEAESRQAEANAQRKKVELDAARDLEIRKLDAAERARKDEAQAAEQRQRLQMEENERKRKFDLEVRALGGPIAVEGTPGERISVSNALKFVPKFDDGDVETFLLAFEKIMALHKFEKRNWP